MNQRAKHTTRHTYARRPDSDPLLSETNSTTHSETNNPNPASLTTENKTIDSSSTPLGVVESSGKSSLPIAWAPINQEQQEQQQAHCTAISGPSRAVPDGRFAIQTSTRGLRLILHHPADASTPLAMLCCPASACAICRPQTQPPPPDRRWPAGPGEEGWPEATAAAAAEDPFREDWPHW
jgi:hypothetical protein